MTVQFSSKHDNSSWTLTCVYGPCTTDGKTSFINWLKEVQMIDNNEYIILGDFNLIRTLEDRNRPRGDLNEMFRFNSAISTLGLNEIKLQGRKFTWSNMQPSSLLEKLDWVFTSNTWISSYPNTSVKALDMSPSDHCPCLISVSIVIPKNKVFKFENYWLKHAEFQEILANTWNQTAAEHDSARNITAKFKALRKRLREWQTSMTNLKTLISNVRLILLF